MPDVARVLKAEIQRLARKEARAANAPLRRQLADARRSIVELRKRLADTQRQIRHTERTVEAVTPEEVRPPERKRPGFRPTSKTVRSLRNRLGISQAKFARLLGVSPHSVYQWEKADGRLYLRSRTRQALDEARSLGAREAKRRLREMDGEA